MHYLEGSFDSALGKISEFLVPDHCYKSVHDYFNPHLFHSALTNILSHIPSLLPHLDQLLLLAALQQNDGMNTSAGFTEVRLKNFTSIWKCLQTALVYEGIEVANISRQKLFSMVKDYDLDCLQTFIQMMFQLLIKDHEAVQHITCLPSEDQAVIKDFLQKAKDKAENQRISLTSKQQEEDQLRRVQEENNELRIAISLKDADMQRMSLTIQEISQQIEELKQLETRKQTQIDSLKKRLLAYQQTDTLFQQKDEEIHKLNKVVGQLQLANRLLNSDLTSEKSKLQTKVLELQHINAQLSLRIQRLSSSYDLVSRQREEIQTSNKKVISNLKDKIKSQGQRISQLQNQLVQAKISRQFRERQFTQLWTNYESLRSQSLNDSLGKVGERQMVRISSTGELDRNLINSSGNHRQFLRLGQQINQLQKFQDNAFQEEIMMFESSQDNLKKVQEIIAENSKLKQKIASLQTSREGRNSEEKLKKRLAVMKKRNDELEQQRRQQLDLMISAFEACLRSSKQQ